MTFDGCRNTSFSKEFLEGLKGLYYKYNTYSVSNDVMIIIMVVAHKEA